MAGHGGPRIVKSNLWICLDATKPGRYAPSEWSDLSGHTFDAMTVDGVVFSPAGWAEFDYALPDSAYDFPGLH